MLRMKLNEGYPPQLRHPVSLSRRAITYLGAGNCERRQRGGVGAVFK